jgi:hypothetical protein
MWQWNYICVAILDMNMLKIIPPFNFKRSIVAGTSVEGACTLRVLGRC